MFYIISVATFFYSRQKINVTFKLTNSVLNIKSEKSATYQYRNLFDMYLSLKLVTK
jgi:hypothetical protein